MRIAIFSDIHGNKYSFFKALNTIRRYSVDCFLYCGDICGYYYQNEIVDTLREIKNLHCVLGNHDKIFLDIIDGKIDKNEYKKI